MLLDYNYWARDRVLDAAAPLRPEDYVRDLSNSFPSIRDTLVHIFSGEWMWCSRWLGEAPTAMLDPEAFPGLDDLRAAWTRHESEMRGAVEPRLRRARI